MRAEGGDGWRSVAAGAGGLLIGAGLGWLVVRPWVPIPTIAIGAALLFLSLTGRRSPDTPSLAEPPAASQPVRRRGRGRDRQVVVAASSAGLVVLVLLLARCLGDGTGLDEGPGSENALTVFMIDTSGSVGPQAADAPEVAEMRLRRLNAAVNYASTQQAALIVSTFGAKPQRTLIWDFSDGGLDCRARPQCEALRGALVKKARTQSEDLISNLKFEGDTDLLDGFQRATVLANSTTSSAAERVPIPRRTVIIESDFLDNICMPPEVAEWPPTHLAVEQLGSCDTAPPAIRSFGTVRLDPVLAPGPTAADVRTATNAFLAYCRSLAGLRCEEG